MIDTTVDSAKDDDLQDFLHGANVYGNNVMRKKVDIGTVDHIEVLKVNGVETSEDFIAFWTEILEFKVFNIKEVHVLRAYLGSLNSSSVKQEEDRSDVVAVGMEEQPTEMVVSEQKSKPTSQITSLAKVDLDALTYSDENADLVMKKDPGDRHVGLAGWGRFVHGLSLLTYCFLFLLNIEWHMTQRVCGDDGAVADLESTPAPRWYWPAEEEEGALRVY